MSGRPRRGAPPNPRGSWNTNNRPRSNQARDINQGVPPFGLPPGFMPSIPPPLIPITVYLHRLDEQSTDPSEPSGQPTIPNGSIGQHMIPTGLQGQMIISNGPIGQPVMTVGPSGQAIMPNASTGQHMIPTGPHEHPMIPTSLQEQMIIPNGSIGQLIMSPGPHEQIMIWNEHRGQPVIMTGPTEQPMVPNGSWGQPMIPSGSHGLPIIPTENRGQPVMPNGSSGQPILPTGFHGQPMMPQGPNGEPMIPTESQGPQFMAPGPQGLTMPSSELQFSPAELLPSLHKVFNETGVLEIAGENFYLNNLSEQQLRSQLSRSMKKVDAQINKTILAYNEALKDRSKIIYCFNCLDNKLVHLRQEPEFSESHGPIEMAENAQQVVQQVPEVPSCPQQDKDVQQNAEVVHQPAEGTAQPEAQAPPRVEILQQAEQQEAVAAEQVDDVSQAVVPQPTEGLVPPEVQDRSQVAVLQHAAQSKNLTALQKLQAEAAELENIRAQQRGHRTEHENLQGATSSSVTFSQLVVKSCEANTNTTAQSKTSSSSGGASDQKSLVDSSSASTGRKAAVRESRKPSTRSARLPRGQDERRHGVALPRLQEGSRKKVVDEDGFILVGSANGQPTSSPACPSSSTTEPMKSVVAPNVSGPKQVEMDEGPSSPPKREPLKRKSESSDEEETSKLVEKPKKPLSKKSKKSSKAKPIPSKEQLREDALLLDECVRENRAAHQQREELEKVLIDYCEKQEQGRLGLTAAPMAFPTEPLEVQSYKLLHKFVFENKKMNWMSRKTFVENVLKTRLRLAQESNVDDSKDLAIRLSILLANVNKVIIQDALFFQKYFKEKGGFGGAEKAYISLIFKNNESACPPVVEVPMVSATPNPLDLPMFSNEALQMRLAEFGQGVIAALTTSPEGQTILQSIRENPDGPSGYWTRLLARYEQPGSVLTPNQRILFQRFATNLDSTDNHGIKYVASNMMMAEEISDANLFDFLFSAVGFNPHEHQ